MDDQPSQTPQTPPTPKAPERQPQTPGAPQGRPGGYGKHPVWQWVVLYIIIGAIVYGLIYYFFMRGSGGASY